MDVCRSLRNNFDVTAHIPERADELQSLLESEGIAVRTFRHRLAKVAYYSGSGSVFHPRMWYYVLTIFLQLRTWRSRLRQDDPDVVIANSSVLPWISSAAPTSTMTVLMVRETLRGSQSSLVNRGLVRWRGSFSLVCYLSDYDRRADGLPDDSTLVVRDAVSPSTYRDEIGRADARQALGLVKDMPTILFLGGSNRLKGLDLLLQAMSTPAVTPVQVLVAGRAPEWQPINGRPWTSRVRFDMQIVRMADSLPPSINLKFIGVQSNVATLISACDLLVFPMRKPHQARPAFEVGFQGKPVVITDFANIRECVRHGWNGLTFKPDDADDLRRQLDELLENAELRRQLGENNRLHAHSDHVLETTYEKFRRELVHRLGDRHDDRDSNGNGNG